MNFSEKEHFVFDLLEKLFIFALAFISQKALAEQGVGVTFME